MSEELENSLQQAVETYLNERLNPISDQISRLQTELSDALARLHDASQAQRLDGTNLSAAIFAHLQTARGQRLSGATFSSTPTSDAGAIKRAVADIENQQSQADILQALLRGSAQFAERLAMFIVKGDQAIGWRMSNASDPMNSQPIGGVSVPLGAQTGLTRAIHSQAPWSGSVRENAEDHLLLDQLGGSAESAAVIPLVVRGKVVAALYADSAQANGVNSDALDVLARVAAMTVNIVSIHRAAPAPKREAVSRRTEDVEPTVAEPASPAEAPAYTPYVEPPVEEVSPASAGVEAQPVEEHEETVEPATNVSPVMTETSVAEAPAETISQLAGTPEPTAVATPEAVASEEPEMARPEEPNVQSADFYSQPQSQPETPAPESEFVSQYATPLGSTRRYGASEVELPAEVGEEERRLHNDARRFARLLVSEIKLYNENKVKEGRTNADLYDRLREDIDRSRQMYDKRVAAPVAARHDYFHQELVNLLAEGDPAKLGQSYQAQ